MLAVMSLTVSDLLAMPVLAAARPEVVAGSALASRPIRWVHTSEIYDIAPLLKGGEVLLTTGLGLVASSPKAQGDYVRALAAKGVAALVMELGRTFTAPPASMVDAARETGLPLVVLHGVVPFIEVTEQVHPLLLSEPDPETTPSRGPGRRAAGWAGHRLAVERRDHRPGVAGRVRHLRDGALSRAGGAGDDVRPRVLGRHRAASGGEPSAGPGVGQPSWTGGCWWSRRCAAPPSWGCG